MSVHSARFWPPGARSVRRWAAWAAVAALAAAAIIGQYAGAADASRGPVGQTAAIAVAFTAMGLLVLANSPGNVVGRLMAAAGGAACVAVIAVSWAGWLPLAWLSQWSWWPPFGLIFLSLLIFPDGRLPSPRWRWLVVLLVGAAVVGSLAFAIAALDHPRTLLSAVPDSMSDRSRLLVRVGLGAMVLTVAGLIGVLCSLGARWRAAVGDTRQQLACLLPAGVLLLLGLVLDVLGLAGSWVLEVVAVPIGMAIAVLRYRLWNLDLVVNRAIVWLVMTLLVIAGFVAIVAVLRDLVMRGSTSRSSLAATGLLAVSFEPLHRRVQLGVDRLLYGDRDDPYKVIGRLGELLGQTVEPSAVLPLLTSTIARSLQVPYVAVELTEAGGPRTLAECGRRAPSAESFEMVAHGEPVGRLIVAPRTSGGHFSKRERRLLRDIALHAAVAAEATRLTRDLQDSRERLVLAREEERRRLRRELHDGLGPSLTGVSMQVRAARKLVHGPGRLGEILDALNGDLLACRAEMRQLVDQLRPPALDRGLEAALREQCERLDNERLDVRLHVEGDLHGVVAATEVAVYRIVAESLNNVIQHSGAGRCTVTVHRAGSLRVEIADDGVGIAEPPRRRGVGLASIRERATELGGVCTVSQREPRGTMVRVFLPAGQPSTASVTA